MSSLHAATTRPADRSHGFRGLASGKSVFSYAGFVFAWPVVQSIRIIKAPRFLLWFGPVVMLMLWYLAGYLLDRNPNLTAFAQMGPQYALPTLWSMLLDGTIPRHIGASLHRLGAGLFYATLIGGLLGLTIGIYKPLHRLTYISFQLLRMTSPLAWMPIAVLIFITWHGAIVFLLTATAIWPILYATANGIHRLNQDWFALARSLRASRWQTITQIIVPAVIPDLFQGLRLAIGIAWTVIVPAELLGVTSGLGYAINDARNALAYDQLAAVIFTIGCIGLLLDVVAGFLVSKFSWQIDG